MIDFCANVSRMPIFGFEMLTMYGFSSRFGLDFLDLEIDSTSTISLTKSSKSGQSILNWFISGMENGPSWLTKVFILGQDLDKRPR
jgi:hypothetical protein